MSQIKLTHKDLVAKVADNLKLPKSKVDDILRETAKVITHTMESKGKVTLSSLGSFNYKSYSSRSCINPKTREKIEVPAKGGFVFKCSASSAEALKKIK